MARTKKIITHEQYLAFEEAYERLGVIDAAEKEVGLGQGTGSRLLNEGCESMPPILQRIAERSQQALMEDAKVKTKMIKAEVNLGLMGMQKVGEQVQRMRLKVKGKELPDGTVETTSHEFARVMGIGKTSTGIMNSALALEERLQNPNRPQTTAVQVNVNQEMSQETHGNPGAEVLKGTPADALMAKKIREMFGSDTYDDEDSDD